MENGKYRSNDKSISKIIYNCDMTYQVDILVSAKLSHKELGIIIHQETVISEKCVIYQNGIFGTTQKEGNNGVPILSNNVMASVDMVDIVTSKGR